MKNDQIKPRRVWAGPYNYRVRFPKLKLMYCEVPKCASSSIKTYLLLRENSYPDCVSFDVGHATWGWLFPKSVVSDSLPIEKGLKYFTMIRNPWNRMLSAYQYTHRVVRKYHDISFKNFILSLPEKMEESVWDTFNNHFRPASFFQQRDSDGSIVGEIFQMEDMTRFLNFLEDLPTLCEQGALVFPHKNKTIQPEKDISEFYDSEMTRVMRSIFEEDFELGDYPDTPKHCSS